MKIYIKKSSEASDDIKSNPFYDSRFWGRALDFNDIFLPNSDEVLSFALAAHEIGHLSKVDQDDTANTRLDNFNATKNEEQRAWRVGKKYLMKHINQYYQDEMTLNDISERIDRVDYIMMKIVDWSKCVYLENGSFNVLNESQRMQIITRQRETLYKEKEADWKKFVQQLTSQEIGRQINWEKFVTIVKLSLLNIIKDNQYLQKGGL
ncbi:MAG: hypothetical protein ABIG10_00325 [bacterium]